MEEPAPDYEEIHKATLLNAELVAQVVQAGKRGTDPKTLAEREELQSEAHWLVPQLKVLLSRPQPACHLPCSCRA